MNVNFLSQQYNDGDQKNKAYMANQTPLQDLLKTTSQKIKLLRSLDIHSALDLLLYFPFRHEDRSVIRPISHFNLEEINTSRGTLSRIISQRTKT